SSHSRPCACIGTSADRPTQARRPPSLVYSISNAMAAEFCLSSELRRRVLFLRWRLHLYGNRKSARDREHDTAQSLSGFLASYQIRDPCFTEPRLALKADGNP